jgi:hypothetical protein
VRLLLAIVLLGAWSPWRVAEVVPWYGPGFYGQQTACGQTMTRKLKGVAHRTLPCGTKVELRWHGRSVVTKVVDRGPWPAPHLYDEMPLDLTAAVACHALHGGRYPKGGCYSLTNVRWRIRT